MSGDARRALNLAAKALASTTLAIGITEMDAILNSNTIMGRQPGISRLGLEYKLVLLSLYNMTLIEPNGVLQEQCMSTTLQLYRTLGLPVPHHTDIARSVLGLVSMGIVHVNTKNNIMSFAAVNREDVGPILQSDQSLSRLVVK